MGFQPGVIQKQHTSEVMCSLLRLETTHSDYINARYRLINTLSSANRHDSFSCLLSAISRLRISLCSTFSSAYMTKELKAMCQWKSIKECLRQSFRFAISSLVITKLALKSIAAATDYLAEKRLFTVVDRTLQVEKLFEENLAARIAANQALKSRDPSKKISPQFFLNKMKIFTLLGEDLSAINSATTCKFNSKKKPASLKDLPAYKKDLWTSPGPPTPDYINAQRKNMRDTQAFVEKQRKQTLHDLAIATAAKSAKSHTSTLEQLLFLPTSTPHAQRPAKQPALVERVFPKESVQNLMNQLKGKIPLKPPSIITSTRQSSVATRISVTNAPSESFIAGTPARPMIVPPPTTPELPPPSLTAEEMAFAAEQEADAKELAPTVLDFSGDDGLEGDEDVEDNEVVKNAVASEKAVTTVY